MCPGAWGQAVGQLSLPAGEPLEPWQQAWAEVEASTPAATADLHIALAVVADGWELGVRDHQGTLRTVAISTPLDHADRLDLLYLALSLARPEEGALSWSDLSDSWGARAEEGPEEADSREPQPSPSASATAALPPRPRRAFVSASSAAALDAPPEEPRRDRTEGLEVAPYQARSEPAAPEPPPDTLEPPVLVPMDGSEGDSDRREPIPILDESKQATPRWPAWAWFQGGVGTSWRPETLPALEGFLRGGWVTHRVRVGAGARIGSPTRMTTFAKQAERSLWNLDLVGGPWVGLFPRVEAGLEAGAALRWFHQGGTMETWLPTPVVAFELAGQASPAPGRRLGLYLRATIDTVYTELWNGESCEGCDHETLHAWNLALGVHAGGRGQRVVARPE